MYFARSAFSALIAFTNPSSVDEEIATGCCHASCLALALGSPVLLALDRRRCRRRLRVASDFVLHFLLEAAELGVRCGRRRKRDDQ